MKKIALIAAVAALSLTACTDAQKASFAALGDSARVICYSGGVKTFDDYSTGKVQSEEGSDGYLFVAKGSNRLVHVSGDCNLDYGGQPPADFKPVHAGQVEGR